MCVPTKKKPSWLPNKLALLGLAALMLEGVILCYMKGP